MGSANAGYRAAAGVERSRLAGPPDCESAWNPAESTTDLSKQLRDWQPDLSPWNEIGFIPDGQVRCNYEMYSCEDTGSTGSGQMLLARGWCDLDQDGVPYQYAQANDSAQAAFGFSSPYEPNPELF